MVAALIAGLVMSFVLCLVAFWVVVWNCNNGHKILTALAVCLLITIFVTGIFMLQVWARETNWNDGKCSKCGEEWELVNVSIDRWGGRHTYYHCPKCDRIIEQ